MSYTLEYSGEIYIVPKEMTGSWENNYVWVLTAGDNNVWEAGNTRRARSTYIHSYGYEYSIIGDVCRVAGSCEGGGYTLNGRATTPENYLKKYRALFKEPQPIQKLFDRCLKAHMQLDLKEEDKESFWKEHGAFLHEESARYDEGKTIIVAKIPLDSVDNLKRIMKLKYYSKYNSVELI